MRAGRERPEPAPRCLRSYRLRLRLGIAFVGGLQQALQLRQGRSCGAAQPVVAAARGILDSELQIILFARAHGCWPRLGRGAAVLPRSREFSAGLMGDMDLEIQTSHIWLGAGALLPSLILTGDSECLAPLPRHVSLASMVGRLQLLCLSRDTCRPTPHFAEITRRARHCSLLPAPALANT
jgi:hypothetical protein